MKPTQRTAATLFAVIGDVHADLPLAAHGLDALERERGRSIDQVFSVGDLGLFLDEEDWQFLTGPHKHRHPELTPKIQRAWEAWRWPLAMIGGNHEPWNKFRDFNPAAFGPLLTFTAAGVLAHRLDGFHAYGLSGIYHPDHLEFHDPGDRTPKNVRAGNWAEFLRLVQTTGKISPKRLTYYKRGELDHLLDLPASPHLLLMHDWPKQPADVPASHAERPERDLVELLRPRFVCCGHHHRPEAFRVGASECRALSIIQHRAPSGGRRVLPGWAWLGEWDAATATLSEVGYWPPLPDSASPREESRDGSSP